ncbi:hypothetical protein IWX64_003149 [Arthrobacter sp. CAN_A212]
MKPPVPQPGLIFITTAFSSHTHCFFLRHFSPLGKVRLPSPNDVFGSDRGV